jgi:hypothetical protein
MRVKIAGLLTAFLMWDLVAAPAGESAVVRGSRAFAETEFAQKFTRYAESGELRDQLLASVASTIAWIEAQKDAAAASIPASAIIAPPVRTSEAVPQETAASPIAAAEIARPQTDAPQVETQQAPAPAASRDAPADAASASAKPDIAGVAPPTPTVKDAVMEAARSDAAMPTEAAAQAVVLGTDLLSAIIAAANKTGADAGYLLHIAVRESGLWPNAKAPTSSATGPYQFVDQTWFRMLALHGAKDGFEKEAAELKLSGGTYRPVTAEAGRKLLALRSDPRASSLMAAELTVDNAAALKAQLGRDATHGELYAAHILGVAGAVTLVRTREKAADTPAASVLPAAAASNRWLFYDGDRPRSVAALFDDISRFQSTREVARVCTAGLNFPAGQ